MLGASRFRETTAMNPVLAVNLALLPVFVFAVAAGLGHSTSGAALGALLALGTVLWRRSRGPVPLLEWTILATLAALAAAGLAGLVRSAGDAASLGFLGLAIGTGASVFAGRPWTADYARAQYQGIEADPLFLRINTVLSALWAAFFLWLAVARALHLPAVASWLPLLAGMAVSAQLPHFWVRRALQARIDAQEPYRWVPPAFDRNGVDVVVVGAGIGGLVAGALLARSGARVLVAEQHTIPGGFSQNWTRTGRDGDAEPVFRFDAGVHDVSGTWPGGPVHGVLARLGLEDAVEWRRLDHRFLFDGAPFDVPRGWDAYVEALAARVPQDASRLRVAMAAIRAIFEGMYSEGTKRSGIPGAPRTVEGMLAFAGRHPLAVRWMQQPFAAFLQAHGLGDEARHLLTSLSGYVTDDPSGVTVAAMVPIFGYTLHGGVYPTGGSGRFAQAFVDAIALDDGEVRLGTPVKRVLVEGGRATGVEFASGEVVRAKAVVLNADFLHATRQLVDPALWPVDFRASIERREPACSAHYVNLGVKGGLDGVRPVIHVHDPAGSVAIVVPTAVDPGAAPAGYSTVELVRLAPHAEAKAWFRDAALTDDTATRNATDYLARKSAMGDDMIRVAERALPGLAARIVYRADASPLTFRRFAWSSFGAIYGSKGDAVATKSPIPGIVFAGAATHGGGIEAVVISGALAAEALRPGLLDTQAPPAFLPEVAGRLLPT